MLGPQEQKKIYKKREMCTYPVNSITANIKSTLIVQATKICCYCCTKPKWFVKIILPLYGSWAFADIDVPNKNPLYSNWKIAWVILQISKDILGGCLSPISERM